MDMVINDIQVHRVLKNIDEKRAYLDSKLVLLYGKQGYLNNKYKTNSYMSSRRINKKIKSTYQANNIEVSVMNVGPPPKALINFA